MNIQDFDGLQLHARELFKNHPHVLDFVEHVLVDEVSFILFYFI